VNFIKRYWRLVIVCGLILANVFIFYVIHSESPTKYLTVAFLNIGQGDAIYIESPTHNKVMIDGGPPRIVLSELRKVMHFYDRTIDTLIVTNPDADHISGFIDILNLYTITRVLEPGTHSTTQTFAALEKSVQEKNVSTVTAQRGMVLHLGSGADLEILFPDQDVSTWKTNDGSIVARLTYGSTSVMFTGDAPNKTEEYVLTLDGNRIKSDILKAGHHGSRTSASESFVFAVNPEYAVISAAKKNKYGHPHKETLDLFNKLGIKILGTYDSGMITMESDGSHFQIKTER
jgi:competence protein ComEC